MYEQPDRCTAESVAQRPLISRSSELPGGCKAENDEGVSGRWPRLTGRSDRLSQREQAAVVP
jgi:hypothetical protein